MTAPIGWFDRCHIGDRLLVPGAHYLACYCKICEGKRQLGAWLSHVLGAEPPSLNAKTTHR